MARPKSDNVQINISIPSESTVGHISEATVIKYIEEQKSHD